jgi:hypothetical protein
MPVWSAELKELEKLYESFKGQLPDLEKELERLVKADDENMILLYSRRCLEVIITDLCECELKRPRKTEPLQGIIDKLLKEEKVPSNIIASMHGLNELSTFGAHPKDFDPKQVRTTLINLETIIEWYIKHRNSGAAIAVRPYEEIRQEIESAEKIRKSTTIPKKRLAGIISVIIAVILIVFVVLYLSNKELEKSIAVLPFINESPVDSNRHFINGIKEEILNNLQTIKEFRVLSRTSTDKYLGPDRPTIPENAKKLNVSCVVEGSGQKFGNTFIKGPNLAQLLADLGNWYEVFGFNGNAIEIYNQLLPLTNDTLQYFQNMSGPFYAQKTGKKVSDGRKKYLGKTLIISGHIIN